MDELIPITRIESFLDGIVNGSAVPVPETRIETFLAKIAGANVVTPEPITRIEVFLAKISGVDIPIPQPITRIEMFLAIISGEDLVPPNPITRIEMYLAQWAEGGTGTIVTVSGTSPLSLVNALAARIKSLTQYGKCEQSGGDIYCNNGTIKARHQSGLPIGYQKLDHVIGKINQTVVDTGVSGDLANLRIVFRGKKTAHSSYSPFFGNYIDENRNVTRIIEGANANQSVLFNYNRKAGGGSASAAGVFPEDAHTYDLSSSGLLVDNNKSFPIKDVSGTGNSTNIGICGSAVPNNPAASGVNTVFVYFRMYQGETLIRNYVPVKRLSDNKVGFYELVNGTFEPGKFAASYAFTAGSPVDDPVEIYIDGTPEVLTVSGKNALNPSVFVNDTGTTLTYTAFKVPNGTYTISTPDYPVVEFSNVFFFAGNVSSGASSAVNGVHKESPRTITVTDGYFTIAHRYEWSGFDLDNSYHPVNYNWQIEVGSTVSAYEPYYNSQTASVVDLFAVGDVKDEQDIISGKVIRRTEAVYSDGAITIQALDTPVTETVTAQHLSTAEGTNTVSVTSNVDPVELKVEYTQGEVE